MELDALEALYPGELQAVLQQCIEYYYDTSLAEHVQQAQAVLEHDLSAIWHQVVGRYGTDVEGLRSEYEQLRQEYAGRMAGYSERLQGLWQAIRGELSVSIPQLDYYPLPAPVPAGEVGEGLYNSARDYLEQIEAYKQFQGKLLQVE